MKYVVHPARAVWFAALLMSCNGRAVCDPANNNVCTTQADGNACTTKAARGALDEACVIEIAKVAVAKRVEGAQYSGYTVRFDPRDHNWHVTIYYENEPPNRHAFVLMDSTGAVEDVREGM